MNATKTTMLTSKKTLEDIIERKITEKKKDVTIDMLTMVATMSIVSRATTNMKSSFCINSIQFVGGVCFTYQLNKTLTDIKNLKNLNNIKKSTASIPENIMEIH